MAVTIYKVLNYSEKILSGWDWADFPNMKDSFLLTSLYARQINKLMPPVEALDLHNNINNKLKLRLK